MIVRQITFGELASFMVNRGGYEVADDENSVHFGAFVEGALVGTCTVQRMAAQPSIATFRHDYVVPAMRRRGIYSQLFAARVAWCRKHGVRFVTTRCTKDSLPMYLKWGFEIPPDWPHLQPVVAEITRKDGFTL
jgi:GNAT superfamily N-acetyltransferase